MTFSVNGSVATNPQMPYDPAPPPGIAPGWGITVNAEFTRDGFQTVQTFRRSSTRTTNTRSRPTGTGSTRSNQYAWKVRFSPPQEGAWEYRIDGDRRVRHDGEQPRGP